MTRCLFLIDSWNWHSGSLLSTARFKLFVITGSFFPPPLSCPGLRRKYYYSERHGLRGREKSIQIEIASLKCAFCCGGPFNSFNRGFIVRTTLYRSSREELPVCKCLPRIAQLRMKQGKWWRLAVYWTLSCRWSLPSIRAHREPPAAVWTLNARQWWEILLPVHALKMSGSVSAPIAGLHVEIYLEFKQI